MGQQQLLLLVLGIVIVGLAVVVGINAFSENRIKSNADALVTDGLRVASDIQAWALKPTQFGGGSVSGQTFDTNTDGITFADIGYSASSGGTYTNVNGDFKLDSDPSSGMSDVTCTAAGSGGQSVIIYAANDDTNNCVVIGINGTSADDIETEVTYGS